MFDIGLLEVVIIAVLGLVVLGPERIPEVLRTFMLWKARINRTFNKVKTEMENELNIEEVRNQLHDEEIIESMSHFEDYVDTDTASKKEPMKDATSQAPKARDNHQA